MSQAGPRPRPSSRRKIDLLGHRRGILRCSPQRPGNAPSLSGHELAPMHCYMSGRRYVGHFAILIEFRYIVEAGKRSRPSVPRGAPLDGAKRSFRRPGSNPSVGKVGRGPGKFKFTSDRRDICTSGRQRMSNEGRRLMARLNILTLFRNEYPVGGVRKMSRERNSTLNANIAKA